MPLQARLRPQGTTPRRRDQGGQPLGEDTARTARKPAHKAPGAHMHHHWPSRARQILQRAGVAAADLARAVVTQRTPRCPPGGDQVDMHPLCVVLDTLDTDAGHVREQQLGQHRHLSVLHRKDFHAMCPWLLRLPSFGAGGHKRQRAPRWTCCASGCCTGDDGDSDGHRYHKCRRATSHWPLTGGRGQDNRSRETARPNDRSGRGFRAGLRPCGPRTSTTGSTGRFPVSPTQPIVGRARQPRRSGNLPRANGVGRRCDPNSARLLCENGGRAQGLPGRWRHLGRPEAATLRSVLLAG